jgi:hypothetical protein
MEKFSGAGRPGLKTGLALLGAAALVAGVGGVAAARSSNPLNLEAAPGVQLVDLGGTAVYTLSLDRRRNFTGSAALSVLSGPSHATETLSSPTITGTQQVTLTVHTSTKTHTGPDRIRIQVTAPHHTETTTVTLYVVRIPLSISVTPRSDTINAGQNATYNVNIRHGRWDPTTKLSVSGLPAGATASFSPSSTTGATAKLTITTSAADTPSGDYPLTITASTGLRSAQGQLILHVGPVAQPFTINGSFADALAPGGGGGIDVTLGNPNSVPITVSGVIAAVTSVNAPTATATLTCTAGDFAPVAMAGTVVVPPGATERLSQLGVDPARFPRLAMTRSSTNQDGCAGATLGLTWTGTATGGN